MKWREKIRAELLQRKRELADELQEVDDLLTMVGESAEHTFSDPDRPTRGRPPSDTTLMVERWLRGWLSESRAPGGVVVVNELFAEAFQRGLVTDDRRGRERIRFVLDRWTKTGEATNLHGGRYRVQINTEAA